MRTLLVVLAIAPLAGCAGTVGESAAPDAGANGASPDATATARDVVWVEWGNRAGMLPADYVFGAAIDPVLPADPAQQLASLETSAQSLVYVASSLSGDIDVGVVVSASPQTWLTAQRGPGRAALSPDGTTMVISRASHDLELVRARAMTPLAPAIANSAATVSSLAWSRDGRYLAFAGDFTSAGATEVYAVDTAADVPARASLIGAGELAGVIGPIAFGADGALYACARMGGVAHVYRMPSDGGARSELALPARADRSASECSALAADPTGTHLVVVADAPTATAGELYAIELATGTTVRLTTGATPGRTAQGPFAFSHAGDQVAFVANFEHANEAEPFVAALSGGAHRILDFQPSGSAGAAATSFAWSLDDHALWTAATPDAALAPSMLYWLDPQRTDSDEPYLKFAPADGVQTVAVLASK